MDVEQLINDLANENLNILSHKFAMLTLARKADVLHQKGSSFIYRKGEH